MKTIKSLLVCALLALTGNAFAQDFSFPFADVSIVPGETADLNVTFTSEVVPAGWQMFIYLPTGITIAEKDDDEYFIELSDAHHTKHIMEVMKTNDGSMMLVMTGGTKTYEMSATEGSLCSIRLKADATFQGEATAEVKKMAIADKSGKQYEMASDASFTITAADVTGISSLNAAENEAAAYNMAGLKVGKNYKGVVVKNGKKTIVK